MTKAELIGSMSGCIGTHYRGFPILENTQLFNGREHDIISGDRSTVC